MSTLIHLRRALCVALLGHCVLASAQSASAPSSSATIYGVLDVGVDLGYHGQGRLARVISGGYQGNRLGFRGNEDLGDGLSAFYRLEMGFATDTGVFGQGGRTFGREASVGLKSNTLGTATLGRLPTPYYSVARYIDAFGWAMSGGTLSLSRGAASLPLQPIAVSIAMDNSIRYDTPLFGGFTAGALVSAGEGSASLGRGVSVGGSYSGGPLVLSLGWAQQKGAGNIDSNGKINALVAGGSYDFGAAQLFAGYQREANDCATCTGAMARGAGVIKADYTVTNLGVRVPIGLLRLIAQVSRIGDRSVYRVDPGDRDSTWFAVGGEYYLSKRTSLWGSVGTLGNKNGSQYAQGTGTVPLPAGSVAAGDPRARSVAAGLRHVF